MDKKVLKEYIVFSIITIIVCYIVKNFDKVECCIIMVKNSLFPFTFGLIIAYILNIILEFFEKHYFPKKQNKLFKSSKRPVCIIISILCAVVILIIIFNIIIPELLNVITLIKQEIPPFLNVLKNFIIKLTDEYPYIQKNINTIFNEFDFKLLLDWQYITSQITNFIKNGFILGIVTSAMSIICTVSCTITNIIISIIFAMYILFRKEKIITDIKRVCQVLIKPNMNKHITYVCMVVNTTFKNFFVGQLIEAIILGWLCFIGMFILNLPYAGMSATIIGVTALIPIIGTFFGTVVSAFIIFTVSPSKALIFIIFLLILQQLENNIIYPKIVGKSVGLPGIWVLVAVILGASFDGILGIILYVPITAIIYKLIFKFLEVKEKEFGIDVNKKVKNI